MYDTFSSDYDRFVNWQNRLAAEMPFIERLLASYGRGARVLDTATGTGMHAIALARQGFSAAGADLSTGMIERARSNAQRLDAAVDFKVAGFGELERVFGAQSFDAVLCLGNSLPHLLDPRTLLAALRDFAAVLRPGGLLLVQSRNFDAVMASQERWMEPQSHREQGPAGVEEWVFLRFYDYLADGLINFNILTLKRTGEAPWQQTVSSTRLYPLREGDLTGVLKAAGFTGVELYGSMAGDPFMAEQSGNLVTAARKA